MAPRSNYLALGGGVVTISWDPFIEIKKKDSIVALCVCAQFLYS
jgi:hypothetical protein